MIVAGKINEAYTTHVRPDMRHHDMRFAGDAISLKKAMEDNHAEYPHKLLEIKQTIEEGNLIAVYSHIQLQNSDPGVAVIHIFRFQDNKIIEIWDIVQAVPEHSPNKNGMF